MIVDKLGFAKHSRLFPGNQVECETLEHIDHRDINVVQVEYTQMAQYCPTTKHVVTLLTEHDVSFLSFQRRFMVTKPLRLKLRALIDWLEVFSFELGACQRFDTVLTVTRKEADFLQSYLPKTRISFEAPTGVDVIGSKEKPKNIFLTPFSVSAIFSMTPI